MKILLAEDTADLNKAVCTMLQMQGYEVCGVFDGEEAVQKTEEDGFDCIILDIMMPKKDGITALKELREKGTQTPVLLLTAKSEVDDRVNGLEAGADDYLSKPFAMKELLARVKALTRRTQPFGNKTLTFSDLKLKQESLEMEADNTVVLSVKEWECMQFLIRHSKEALTPAHFIEQIWKDEEAGEETVLLYINYLRQKLFSIGSVVEVTGDREKGFQLMEGKN
jgi:DNA-binding response OmpR family regulator